MRQILLVRHGMPVCDRSTRIRGCDFHQWVQAYDAAPIAPTSRPSAALMQRAAAAECVVTSTLRRSIESARLLAPQRDTVSDPLFNEVGIPTALPAKLALPPNYWDVLARSAWLLGWAPDTEKLRDASARAALAAQQLTLLARAHHSVLLVGHGMLNTLIKGALRRAGWRGTGSARAYWGAITLQLR